MQLTGKETRWAVCQTATSQSYDRPQNKFNPSGSVSLQSTCSGMAARWRAHVQNRVEKRAASAPMDAQTARWKLPAVVSFSLARLYLETQLKKFAVHTIVYMKKFELDQNAKTIEKHLYLLRRGRRWPLEPETLRHFYQKVSPSLQFNENCIFIHDDVWRAST